VGSFIGLVLAGTVGFKLIPGLYFGDSLSWLNALFTATSAVCVTGLIVVDTATHFTPLGQAYILLLIQLGGLGIIAFTSLLISMLGIRLSLRHESIARSSAQVAPRVDTRKLVRHVIAFTLIVEAVGAVLLYVFWLPTYGVRGAVWPAVFHAISAFCNAGFSTFSDSLMGSADQPFVLTVIMILIVLGGLGFLVLEELYQYRRERKAGGHYRLSVHTRLVLVTTGILLGGGWIFFLVFEWGVSFSSMPAIDRVVNALFMSVTARTAGFNTVDYSNASSGSNFLYDHFDVHWRVSRVDSRRNEDGHRRTYRHACRLSNAW